MKRRLNCLLFLYYSLLLTDGKIVLGRTKAWFGSGLTELTKDTNKTYDLSKYATKSDLETVKKEMSDVGAKIVYSCRFNTENSDDITITVPEYDYCEITVYPYSYYAAYEKSNTYVTYSASDVPLINIIVYKNSTAYIPAYQQSSSNYEVALKVRYLSLTTTNTKLSIGVNGSYTSYGNIVFYKYTS